MKCLCDGQENRIEIVLCDRRELKKSAALPYPPDFSLINNHRQIHRVYLNLLDSKSRFCVRDSESRSLLIVIVMITAP